MTNGLDDAAWRRAEAQGEIAQHERRASGETSREDAEREAAEVARLERELALAKQNEAADKTMASEAFGRSIGQTANRNGMA